MILPGGDRADAARQPDHSTGASRWVFVLSPILSNPFQPQHLTPLLAVTAHVWDAPASMAITPLARPATLTGRQSLVVGVRRRPGRCCSVPST